METMDKMIWQNKEYNLAKNNMKMARLISAAEESETMVDAYNNQLSVVTEALGRETAGEILGTLDIEEIDLGSLVLVYNAVIEGYERRIMDMRTAKDEKVFNSSSFKNFGKFATDVRTIEHANILKK